MVKAFIDLESGVTFNGNKPYVFWFDEGQSVNIIYVKKIVFLSDTPTCSVTLGQDSKFFLIDPAKFAQSTPETINSKSYYVLADISTNSLSVTGTPYGSLYLNCIWVCATSSDAGEYTDDISIGNEVFSLGADFYNEEEVLTSNLENMGIEIPETVQKAIYESNVHEEATDNILMNRKWKELLLEYWNIVARKGSYKSLIDSLKWFEYGDLVRILEYWKRTDGGRRTLISNDIEQIVSDLFRKQLSVLSKTTYIGLYLALEKSSQTETDDSKMPFFMSNEVWADPSDEDGTTQYSGGPRILQENNPVLHQIASIWSAIDLSLKMTLVGNFYATYFMPVHLDLIHSTIENVIYTNTIKILHHGTITREDWVDLGGSFLCDSVKEDSDWYMQPVECNVGPLTILGLKNYRLDSANPAEITNEADTDGAHENCPKVLGFTHDMNSMFGRLSVREWEVPGADPVKYEDQSGAIGTSDLAEIAFLTNNIYTAFGAPVHFDVTIRQNVKENDFLHAAAINWTRDGSETFGYVDRGIYEWPKQKNIYKPILDSDGNTVHANSAAEVAHYITAHPDQNIINPVITKGDELWGEFFDHWEYSFDFDLLFQKAGSYTVSIMFESASGYIYTKRFKFNVLDDADNHIDIYKITRMDPEEWKNIDFKIEEDTSDPHATETLYMLGLNNGGDEDRDIMWNANGFFNTTAQDPEGMTEPFDFSCAQFIHAADSGFSDTVGLNHVIMYPHLTGQQSVFSSDFSLSNGTNTVSGANLFSINDLKAAFPNYWWIKKDTKIWLAPTDQNEEIYHDGTLAGADTGVIIGICKNFTYTGSDDPEKRVLFDENIHRSDGNGIYPVRVVQTKYFIAAYVGQSDPVKYFAKDATDLDIPLGNYHTLKLKVYPDPNLYKTVKAEDEPGRITVNGHCSRLVDEDRFIPIFHTLTPITDSNWLLRPGDTAVAVPHFGITETENYPDEVIMSFTHCGTADKIDYINGRSAKYNPAGGTEPDFFTIGLDVKAPVSSQALMIGNYKPAYLKPGYYDVSVRYKFGGEWHEETSKGAFKVGDFTCRSNFQ